MKKTTSNSVLFSILTENQKGVLARILAIIDRPNYHLETMTMGKTDVNGQVLITLEALIPAAEQSNIACRIEKIIEVEKIECRSLDHTQVLRSGLFQVNLAAADHDFWRLIQKSGATVTGASAGKLLLQKTAQAEDLRELYNILDREYLESYSETTLPQLHTLYQVAE